jgi:hypothetical protein
MTFTYKIARRLAVSRLASFASIALVSVTQACSGGDADPLGPSTPADQPSAALTLSPQATVAQPNQPIQFAAFSRTEAGDSTPAQVEWSATGGAILPSGRFTATAPGTYSVIARNRATPDQIDTAIVTVSPPADTVVAPPADSIVAPPADTAPTPPPPPAGFANMPTGMAKLLEHSFDGGIAPGAAATGEMSDPTGNLHPATAGDAPLGGSGGVLRTTFGSGLAGGVSPGKFDGWDVRDVHGANREREIYVSTHVKIEKGDFENQKVGTKLWYVGYGNTNQTNDAYLMMHNGTGAQTVQSSMKLIMYVSPTDDREGGSVGIYPNRSDKQLTAGQWHHVEVYLNVGTPNQANGTVKVWIDGELVTERTDVKFLDSDYGFTQGFFNFQWTPVWGGNGGSRTRTDDLLLDHLLVAGRD